MPVLAYPVGIVLGLGWFYWIWMAVQLGSFLMVFLSLLGPFAGIAGFFGAHAFVFGIPTWIPSWFG